MLESFYEVERAEVGRAVRSILAFPAIRTLDAGVLRRAIEVYERPGLDFAEAYLVASAEATGVGRVASFDRAIDRVGTVERVEPA